MQHAVLDVKIVDVVSVRTSVSVCPGGQGWIVPNRCVMRYADHVSSALLLTHAIVYLVTVAMIASRRTAHKSA